MMKLVAFLLVLAVVLNVAIAEGNTYYAAASVHNVVEGRNPVDTLLKNMNVYVNHTRAAASVGAQIIVFPEFGLGGNFSSRAGIAPFTEHIPNVAGLPLVNPCASALEFQDRPVLLTASCMASSNNIVVVLNMYDQQPCQPNDNKCPKDGLGYLYNTLVVFDQQGALLAKYWKMHPWLINAFNAPGENLVTFATGFGPANFGAMVCFDIAFPSPGPVIRKQGVSHFVYPASEYGFGSAIAHTWTYAYNATIILANLGNKNSGVYSKGRVLPSKSVLVNDEQINVVSVPY